MQSIYLSVCSWVGSQYYRPLKSHFQMALASFILQLRRLANIYFVLPNGMTCMISIMQGLALWMPPHLMVVFHILDFWGCYHNQNIRKVFIVYSHLGVYYRPFENSSSRLVKHLSLGGVSLPTVIGSFTYIHLFGFFVRNVTLPLE